MEGPRSTRREEFKKVMRLVNCVFRQSRGHRPDMMERYPLLFNYNNLDNMRIILDKSKPICHVGIVEGEIILYGYRLTIACIGSVCTAEKYRGQGLATKLLKDCFHKLDRDNIDLVLISGERNLYKQMGCVTAGKIYNIKVKKKNLKGLKSQRINLVPYKNNDINKLVDAYQKKAVRFHRSVEDFKKLLGSNCAMCRDVETLLVYGGNKCYGYLTINISENKGYIAEYAGSPKLISKSLKAVFDKYRILELSINIPFYETELLSVLDNTKFEIKVSHIPGVIGIINFLRLIRKIQPYLEERLGKELVNSLKINEENGKFVFGLNKDKLVISDRARLIKFIFGSPYTKKLNVKKNELFKLLSKKFPISFPWPGFNFV